MTIYRDHILQLPTAMSCSVRTSELCTTSQQDRGPKHDPTVRRTSGLPRWSISIWSQDLSRASVVNATEGDKCIIVLWRSRAALLFVKLQRCGV